VTDEAHFTDLGADWLDRLDLMVVIEDRFADVVITDEEVDHLEVVGDLIRHIENVDYVTSLTPIWRIASTMFWPCETRTSTCRSFATISSGLYRFLAIAVLLDVKDIPQVGPLQWGWISRSSARCKQGLPFNLPPTMQRVRLGHCIDVATRGRSAHPSPADARRRRPTQRPEKSRPSFTHSSGQRRAS
jgi:acyl carrier protein